MESAYKIRPAGRHLHTIGSDLIKDQYAAIVELVKNSYDADSEYVSIEFLINEDRKNYKLIIEDEGHGMSKDVVVNKWLVPSTDDKKQRRVSPKGRVMQGSKGIGRYAASLLGDELLLETTTPDGLTTTILITWEDFNASEYLDQVEVLVETKKTNARKGTVLTISGGEEHISGWDEEQLDKLNFELKKLMSPVDLEEEDGSDNFKIYLTLKNMFPAKEDVVRQEISPYPIFKLFDYRISGYVNSDGRGELVYSLQKTKNVVDEKIPYEHGKPTQCGRLFFDIRVFDREQESIEGLINKGLRDEAGNYVGKLQARQLLNTYNGIGVYRNGFRIRPLGDSDFDWLKLNEQRVQNPSTRIGNNQVIGFVKIESEDISNLIEKSARDGLRENDSYEQLKLITKAIIGELEQRRFEYRRNAGLSRPALKIEREFEHLFSYEEIKNDVRAKLKRGGVDSKVTEDVIKLISEDESERNRIVEDIRRQVAVYQGQATLGKIMNVILHEGRRPLSYFRNQIPRIRKLYAKLSGYRTIGPLNNLLSMVEGVGDNAETMVELFGRLDPLAAGNRTKKVKVRLKREFTDILLIFREELKAGKVKTEIHCPDDFIITIWKQDLYAIFTNLIDNSLYWMKTKKVDKPTISISVVVDGTQLLYIDYRDSGPGIDKSFIKSAVIYEPQFSTKPNGTGLGLAIAGEAAVRNGLELRAFESEQGAYFRVQSNTGVDDD